MSKTAIFIALPMSINPRKWYLAYSIMLINFKKVILSVTLQQSVTIYKQLRFRLLCRKVILCIFLLKNHSIVILAFQGTNQRSIKTEVKEGFSKENC